MVESLPSDSIPTAVVLVPMHTDIIRITEEGVDRVESISGHKSPVTYDVTASFVGDFTRLG